MLQLSDALAKQAARHAESPWVARTHGQPAQPATFGFLLAAHAERAHDAAQRVLHAFERCGESPLGMGAVAGSTLPLDPAYTAGLLGLRSPRNALLSTGTRDAVVEACMAAAQCGAVLSGLCEDLMAEFGRGALRLPAGYTTGSSLMPQKRNPDTLELVRGKARALAGPLVAALAMTSPLGLGYQRDLQATKPLLQSVRDAAAAAELIAPAVDGLAYDASHPAVSAEWAKPGIVATDVAEALVATGMPFRTAYTTVAGAFAAVEEGASLAQALGATGLSSTQLEAALAASQPDPARRSTIGGPAPKAVRTELERLGAANAHLGQAVAAAQRACEAPLSLLVTPVTDLVS